MFTNCIGKTVGSPAIAAGAASFFTKSQVPDPRSAVPAASPRSRHLPRPPHSRQRCCATALCLSRSCAALRRRGRPSFARRPRTPPRVVAVTRSTPQTPPRPLGERGCAVHRRWRKRDLVGKLVARSGLRVRNGRTCSGAIADGCLQMLQCLQLRNRDRGEWQTGLRLDGLSRGTR